MPENTAAVQSDVSTLDTPCPGVLFILVGPSGVGKNEVMKGVLARLPQLQQLATATTRPMRDTEKQGREHHFMPLEEFHQLMDQGELVEFQEVYPGKFYGTPRKLTQQAFDAKRSLIADIDVIGAQKVQKAFPDHVVSIFIAPPSLDVLEQRLRKRGGMTDQEITERIQRAPLEMATANDFNHFIVNPEDALEQSVQAVCNIIQQELQRRGCV